MRRERVLTSTVLFLCLLGRASGIQAQNVSDVPPTQNPDCSSIAATAGGTLFDFLNGYLVLIPFPILLENSGGFVQGGDGSFWTHPPLWTGQPIMGSGVILMRNDGQAFFKNTTIERADITTDPLVIFREQLGRALLTYGVNDQQLITICEHNREGSSGLLPTVVISGFYEVAGYTLMVAIQAQRIESTFPKFQNISRRVAVAPTPEFEQLAAKVFMPMYWQQFPGGGGQPECNDGADNDGDRKVDFGPGRVNRPPDPQCTSLDDTSESPFDP